MTEHWLLFVSPIVGLVGIVIALLLYGALKRRPAGNDKMKEIAGMIRHGAMVFLRQEYSVLFFFIVV